ncbi:TPA: helix-turn-helix domain-containing protein [Citrobacter freundii]|nr:helix-turn-helix domain-containing protein [Citrobacter freundii]HEE0080319.1 helix-turn-helix domain-containing protein [Citrobacter freundii]HEE9999889.1 helix-turn-helix domain-containing protein [Citrobacter freundii]HEF0020869.1 helix-turn-helix domain-containing protein [Citrobacter freundii]HEF0045979.1 helix-turn-helix domain-containing protein [Citrobacter freundii]
MNEQVEVFSVQFLNVIKQSFLPENRIQLILVLKGEITLTVEGKSTLTMQENQPQVINCNNAWHVTGVEDNILIIVSISPFLLFNQASELHQFIFKIQEYQFPDQARKIAERIKDIATFWLKQNTDTWRLEAIRILLEILCTLHQYFKMQVSLIQTNQRSSRISKAVSWIKAHYQEDITLNQIASQLHVSPPHLSRRFSAEVGMSFRAFLTNIRFEHAVKEIAFTTHPVGQIISDNGFRSLHRFSVLFRERYGLSPGRWRHSIKTGAVIPTTEHIVHEEISQLREVSSVVLFSRLSRSSSFDPQMIKSDSPYKVERIAPSFYNDTCQMRTHRYAIAVGNLNEVLKQHVQQQLICLKSLLSDFQVEINDPLEDIAALYSIHTGESNPTWSPWSNLNMACSFLKKIGVGVIFRLSPSSESVDLLIKFIHHNILLLGADYLQNWSFILEPAPAKNEYPYEILLKWLTTIRYHLPQSKVGLSWLQENHEENTPPVNLLRNVDFIGLSIITNINDNVQNTLEYKPLENNEIIRNQIKSVVSYLHKHSLNCQLYLQSWSTLTGKTLTINGLFFRGALLMDMMLSLPKDVTMLGLWLNSEQQNEVRDNQVIENNSLSLFFSETTKRPVFHILSMKERLNGELCDMGPDWIATRNGNVYHLLLLNTVTINPLLSVQQHLLNDYRKCFHVQLKFNEPSIWRIKKWVFDQKNGALYHQYGLHPTRYDRDEETMRYISQRSEPTLSVYDEFIINVWNTEIMMDINAVCLLEMIRVEI